MLFDSIIQHHGIKGQKWGVRRFQNEDGTLTPAGIERYRTDKESDDALRKTIKSPIDLEGWNKFYQKSKEKSGSFYNPKSDEGKKIKKRI